MKIFFPCYIRYQYQWWVIGLCSRKNDDDVRDIIRTKMNLSLIITSIPTFNLTLFDNYLSNLFDTALQYLNLLLGLRIHQ